MFQPFSYDQRILSSFSNIRSFHSSAILSDNKSKIEKTVNLYKNQMKSKQRVLSDPLTNSSTSTELTIIKRKSIRERIVHECKHYYSGFKLLFIETKIAFRLFRRVLNGHTLTRRERKQVRLFKIDFFV